MCERIFGQEAKGKNVLSYDENFRKWQKARERERERESKTPGGVSCLILGLVAFCFCSQNLFASNCSITWSGNDHCYIQNNSNQCNSQSTCLNNICNIMFHQRLDVVTGGVINEGETRYFKHFTCGAGTHCYYTHRHESFCDGTNQHIEFNSNEQFVCKSNERQCSDFPLYGVNELWYFDQRFVQADQIGKVYFNNRTEYSNYNVMCGFQRQNVSYQRCLNGTITVGGDLYNGSIASGVRIVNNTAPFCNHSPEIDYSQTLDTRKKYTCYHCKQNYVLENNGACRCPTENGFVENTTDWTCACPDGLTEQIVDSVNKCVVDAGVQYTDSTGVFTLSNNSDACSR